MAPVAKNRFFPPDAIQELTDLARKLATEDAEGEFTAQQYKDASGIGRNVTIEVLEYLDQIGVTKRRGNARIIAG